MGVIGKLLSARKPLAQKAFKGAAKKAKPLDMLTNLPISDFVDTAGQKIISKQYPDQAGEKMFYSRPRRKSYLEIVVENELYKKKGVRKYGSKKGKEGKNNKKKRRSS